MWVDRHRAVAATLTHVISSVGIGKSIFCAYFLRRFSFEAKEATVITASFSRKSVWKKVAVWKGGQMLDSARGRLTDNSGMSAVIEKAETGATNKLLYLIDGPPQVHPEDVQSVVFASPNDDWFKYIMKDSTRPMVVMPLWTMKELETASIELGLTVRAGKPQSSRHANKTAVEPKDVPVVPKVADLVDQRFQIFGGVARACLSRDEAFVQKQQDGIETTVKKFKDILGLQAILNQEKDHEKMYHRICYFVPNELDPTKYTIAEPTPFVKQLLIECMCDLTKSQRETIIDLLKHNSAAASFRGALFEISVHDQLSSGHKFEARQLGGNEDSTDIQTFECVKSTPEVPGKAFCYFDEDFSASVLSSGPYHVPASKRFASVDSFYYKEALHGHAQAPLCLFQMTVAKSHPVKGAGLVSVLSKLGWLEKVRANPKLAALIFAVPLEVEQAFTRQTFVLDGILGDADSVRDVRDIGAVTENALKQDPINVRTVGELRAYLEKHPGKADKERVAKGLTFGKLRRLLSNHDKAQEKLQPGERGESNLKDVLESIPQFVWGVGASEEERAEES
jgi:hypothetical protein